MDINPKTKGQITLKALGKKTKLPYGFAKLGKFVTMK